jgi:ferredoxin-type protein NapF
MTASRISRRQFVRAQFGSKTYLVRPPWALREEQFIAACTRCGDCLRVCPTGILRSGDGGFPQVDFARGECTFCAACVESCAAGALMRPTDDAAPWRLQAEIGSSCLAQREVMCAICREQCPSQAIRLVRAVGRVPRPQIDIEVCNGCGACVAPCPSAAISIQPPVYADGQETVCM